METKASAADSMPPDAVAIIGIGCRLPGGSDDPESFWELLRQGVDAIGEVPPDRWDGAAFYQHDGSGPGKIRTRWGGFVERIADFDAAFFGISPREAARMDPQQRLLLETAWEALEDAGQPLERLSGAAVGVFVGVSSYDYGEIHHGMNDRDFIDAHTNTGVALSIAANRISYAFNFTGPSMAIDTACSSSLVAIHLACRSLASGECTLALAGGVNAILKPELTIGFSKASMLSPDGRCRSFDARANGYARGEGSGLALLKPLARALADGDPIYAIIRGSAINQDGRTNGMTVPGRASQEAMLREAYARAGVAPGRVQYVEAHGTGTPVGDPIEARALGAVLRSGRAPGDRCAIGSVKTNIGHLEAAAGIAGLIKAALTLQRRAIPASLHFQSPNPAIPLDDLRLRVPQALEPWPAADGPALAGVNSFGFGGANAHVVLQAPPDPQSAPPAPPDPAAPRAEILPLSARSPEALQATARAFRRFLADQDAPPLRDICYSAGARRSHHDHCLALVAESAPAFVEQIDAFLAGELRPGMASGYRAPGQPPRIVFVFSGMGPQWWAMGRQLLDQEPIFRAAVERCDALFRQAAGWSLIDELTADESDSRMGETAVAQPANFALQVGLAELWRSWGVAPDAIVGHSTGEVAAAYAAGALSLEDAVRVAYHRSRLQQRATGRGRMLAVGLPLDAAERELAGYRDRIAVAAINSPGAVTLSGDADALEQLAGALEQRQVFCRFLHVSVPYHSHHMDPLRDDLLDSLRDIAARIPALPIYSTVTGERAEDGAFGAAYWWRNVRDPVLFAAAADRLIAEGYDLFLEIGPHPVLAGPISESLAQRGQHGVILASLRRHEPERAQMLAALGRMYTLGYPLDWARRYPEGGRFVRLPRYPWQRERHWHESEASRQSRMGGSVHPLLGRRIASAHPTWEVELDRRRLPYLDDHQVQASAVYPGAAYVEAALAAGREVFGAQPCAIEAIEFTRALILPEGDPLRVQMTVDPRERGFAIYSRAPAGDPAWTLHAAGKLRPRPPDDAPARVSIDEILDRCDEIRADDCYAAFHEHGLEYGPCFRGIAQIWLGRGEALSRIRLPDAVAADAPAYLLHPALLDAAFQGLIGALNVGDGAGAAPGGLYLPVKIGRMTLYRRPGARMWGYARILTRRPGSIEGDALLLDDAGNVVAEARRLRCRALEDPRAAAPPPDDCFYQFQWQAGPHLSQDAPRSAADLPTPRQIAAQVQPTIERMGAQFERERYYAKVEPQIDRACVAYALDALRRLGWDPRQGERVQRDDLVRRMGVADQHARLVGRMLEMLQDSGALRADGSGWVVARAPEAPDPGPLCQALLDERPDYGPELRMLARCASRLPEALRGQIDPLELLFPDGSLAQTEEIYRDARSFRFYNLFVAEALRAALERMPEGRALRVLEIGAGTGGVAASALPLLPPNRTEYVFTDVSSRFTARAEQKFRDYPFVRYALLDIEADPVAQGFAANSFDLVIAANVLHATRDLRETIANVRRLLAPAGLLALMELTGAPYWFDLTFGLLKGWWRFDDAPLRRSHPWIAQRDWLRLLGEAGFAEAGALADARADGASLHSVILARGPDADPADRPADPGLWLIFGDRSGVGAQLAGQLAARGERAIQVAQGEQYRRIDDANFAARPDQIDDLRALLDEIGRPVRSVVHLWSIDAPPADALTPAALMGAQAGGSGGALRLVQALAARDWPDPPRIWIVTAGVHAAAPGDDAAAVAQAPAWGLGRVIMNERPRLRCTLVDLPARVAAPDVQRLIAELRAGDNEQEVALRGDARYVHRLRRAPLEALAPPQRGARPADDRAFQLEIDRPGALDRLALRESARRPPGPGEVEIQVCAAGLNFRDVMKALGIYPTEDGERSWLGDECAGVVVAVGAGVSDLTPGDAVVAIVPGCFSAYATVAATFVAPKPARLSFEEAATIPIVFLTAYYALYHLARLRRGERVLIHAAAGGVGLAAIQLAQLAGAEIFATAGSPEKRAFLRSLGVPHIMDSRSLDFADEIMERTAGQGVDVALNSLAGETIPRSIATLGPYGRFLEIGKQDIYQNNKLDLLPFRKNLSFFAIDLGRMIEERPGMAGELFREVMRLVETEALRPLPLRAFPISEAESAFRYMAQARHIGKIVLSLRDPAAMIAPPAAHAPPFRADATYLISGGLGGFGLLVARWMVDQGARRIVLAGRSGARSDAARQALDRLRAAGAQVVVAQADVAQADQVAAMLADIAQRMPPLRGVVHAAMTLDDAFLEQLDQSRLDAVLAPKMLGAWNLHAQTQDAPLDFFVMFSSFAALLGNPGQGNYVAANAFLDALATHRRARERPGQAISWGAIGEVGYVARHGEISQHFARQGLEAFAPAQATALLGRMLETNPIQAGAILIDWRKWSKFSPEIALSPRFAHLLAADAPPEPDAPAAAEQSTLDSFRAATPDERLVLLEARLCEQVAVILGTTAARLDARQPLAGMGFDSLMAVELRYWIEDELGIDVPTMALVQAASITQLAAQIAAQLTAAVAAPAPQPAIRSKEIAS